MCPTIKSVSGSVPVKETTSVNNEINVPTLSRSRSNTIVSKKEETETVKTKSQSNIKEIEKDISVLDNKTVKPGRFEKFVDSIKSLFTKKEKFVSEAVDGNLKIPEGVKPEVAPNPGVRKKLTKDIEIDGVQFKKGEICESFTKDGSVFLQKLKKDDKGEMQPDTDVARVSTTELNVVKDDGIKFKKTDKPLFVNPPTTLDIKQGAIGDCYLIAGLSAMVQKDPSTIYNMIKDNGNGTVTVKLFSKNENDELKPKYITFEKSVLNNSEKAKDTLWVQMIEKAYAIEKGGFESIGHGGSTNEVFETLLGQKATKTDLKFMTLGDTVKGAASYSVTPEKLDLVKGKLSVKGIDITDEEINKLKTLVDKDFEDPKDIQKEIGKILELDPGERKVTQIKDVFFNINKLAFMELLNQSETYKNLGNSTNEEDFKKFVTELKVLTNTDSENITVNGKTLKTSVAKEFVGKIETRGEGQFPGLTGSGKYTESQKELFKTIKEALSENKYVALGTKEDIGKASRLGHSAGESVVEGLVGKHAYALTDVVEMHGKMFIKVANPWGSTSRDYTVNDDGSFKAREFDKKNYSYLPKNSTAGLSEGESWIELNDLTTNYQNLYMTEK